MDQLTDMARAQTDQAMQIVVSPGEGGAVRALVSEHVSVPVKVKEDENLSSGQAYLRVGDAEREINSSALLESIHDSIDAFTYHVREDSQYG